MSLISCDGISEIYKMGEVEIKALNNVSVEISKSQFISFIGPSGSGKTTMLNLFGAVIRGETACYFDKRFSAEDFSVNGIKEKDYLHYLVGYDHNWFGVNVSFQFIQEYILDYEDDLKNDEFTSTSTFLASKTFLNETMELSLFSYFGINNEDALLHPKLSYDLSDGFNVLLGADVFIGKDGNFGQYDENDMVYMKVRYDF